jgi:hypothetical protein
VTLLLLLLLLLHTQQSDCHGRLHVHCQDTVRTPPCVFTDQMLVPILQVVKGACSLFVATASIALLHWPRRR